MQRPVPQLRSASSPFELLSGKRVPLEWCARGHGSKVALVSHLDEQARDVLLRRAPSITVTTVGDGLPRAHVQKRVQCRRYSEKGLSVLAMASLANATHNTASSRLADGIGALITACSSRPSSRVIA